MFTLRFVFLLLILAPFLELVFLFRIAKVLGPGSTLAWLVGTALLGWALCRGLRTRIFQRLQEAARAERVGGTQGVLFFDDVTATAVRGLSGLLLILPGAITDALGLLLLLPPLRLLVLWWLRSTLVRSVDLQAGGAGEAEREGRAGGQDEAGGDGPHQGGEGTRRAGDDWVVRDVDFEIVGEEEHSTEREERSDAREED